MKSIIKIFPITALLLISACATEGDSSVRESELILEDVIKSGDEESENPPLSFISRMAADSENNIYVYDDRAKRFHRYDPEGNRRESFGSSGSGPGEIGRITAVYIDSRDRLIAADMEHSRLSVFDRSGRPLDSKPSPGMRSIHSIREMPDGRYVLTGYGEGNLVHIMDPELRNAEARLVTVDDFAEYDSQMELQWFQNQPGHAEALSDDLIAFVPANYQGVVYLYSRSAAGRWELSGTMEGYASINPAITFSPNKPSGEPVHGVSFSSDGRIYITYHALSFGLYQMDGDKLFHVSLLTADEHMDLMIEQFDISTEKLEAFGTSDRLEIGHTLRKQPLWMDKNRNMYLSDNSADPYFRVLRTEFAEIEPQ